MSDYSNPSTPSRTYNFSYLSSWPDTSPYVYIRNRLTSATVTGSGSPVTLVTNNYDGTQCGPLQYQSAYLHDDGTYGTGNTARGNVTQTSYLGDSTCFAYQTTGIPYVSQNGAGNTVNTTPSAATNYSLPGVITPGSNGGNSNLATTVSYSTSFAVTQVVSPSGATSTTSYDSYGRPQSSTIPDGATTTYSYTYNPNTQTATITNGSSTQWVKTTLDGFGRTLSVQKGHDSVTVNEVDTQYAPCGCSPLGKMNQVSQPYAPGSTKYWTIYTYDARGRTSMVTKADGASSTMYSYSGNNTTITDATGKWKTRTVDGSGNLITVTEPDPANPTTATFVTNYTYDVVNRLVQVSMPRYGIPRSARLRTPVRISRAKPTLKLEP